LKNVRVRALLTVAVAAALGRAALACVIDLDPVGVGDPGVEAGADGPSMPTMMDAGRDTAIADECRGVADCVVGTGVGSGCVTPSCNAGRCEFSFCSASKCGLSRCDTSGGGAGTCAPEVEAGFVSAALGAIPLDVGCKDVSRCIAVSHPLVFVSGGPFEKPVTAYNVGDLGKPMPIEVTGLTMDPQYVVASGRRVYFVALPSFGGTGFGGITIGWVDLPANPYVAKLVAQQVEVPFTGATLAGAFAAPGSGLFISTTQGQIARVTPGQDDAAVAAVRPGNVSAAARFLAESGEQLAFGVLNTSNNSNVGLVSAGILFNPGASSATAPPLVNGSALGHVSTPQLFGAPGPDGSVIATLAVGDFDAAVGANPAAVINVRAVKLVRLVAPGSSGVTVGPAVELAVYQGATSDSGALSTGTRVVAAPAVVGDDILAISHIKDGGTLVQGVSLDPDGGQPTLQNRTLSVPTALFTSATQGVGTTASGGFAYLLVSGGTDGGVGVLLMKPGCDP